MGEAYIYADDEKFGQAVGVMLQVGEQMQAVARVLAGAVVGELGPPSIEKGALVAADFWAKGANKLAKEASTIAENISADIANYTGMDKRAQALFLNAIAGEDVNSRAYPQPSPGSPGERRP